MIIHPTVGQATTLAKILTDLGNPIIHGISQDDENNLIVKHEKYMRDGTWDLKLTTITTVGTVRQETIEKDINNGK